MQTRHTRWASMPYNLDHSSTTTCSKNEELRHNKEHAGDGWCDRPSFHMMRNVLMIAMENERAIFKSRKAEMSKIKKRIQLSLSNSLNTESWGECILENDMFFFRWWQIIWLVPEVNEKRISETPQLRNAQEPHKSKSPQQNDVKMKMMKQMRKLLRFLNFSNKLEI